MASKVLDNIIIIKARKKNVLVLVIGWVDFDANKKTFGPQNITRHRLQLSIINDQQTVTKTCSFSHFNLQYKILLPVCLALFTMIPGTWEMFSQVALDI